MADLAWSDWLDEVLVPKAPRALIQNAVRDAARTLCGRGRVYLLESDAIDIVGNTKEYAWAKTGYTNVEACRLWQVLYNSRELTLITRLDLQRLYENWAGQAGAPQYALRLRPSVARLVPYPTADVAGGLLMHAYVRPTLEAVGIVDEIGEEHFELIGTGAKAKLLGMKGMPYYDPGEARRLAAEFEAGIAEASHRADVGDTDEELEGQGEFY